MLKATLIFILVFVVVAGFAWGSIKALDRAAMKRLPKKDSDQHRDE